MQTLAGIQDSFDKLAALIWSNSSARREDESRESHWQRLRNLQTGIRNEPLPVERRSRSRTFSFVDLSNQTEHDADSHESKTTFWSLPLEIRLKIYEILIGNRDVHLYLQSYERRSKPASESWTLNHCLADPKLPRPRDPMRAWPRFVSIRCRDILPLLQTCRRIYTEALPILYKSNTFYFTDPHSLICFPRLILPHRRLDLRKVHLFWFLPGQLPPRNLEHRIRRTWREFWEAIASLGQLRILSVRILSDFEPQQPASSNNTDQNENENKKPDVEWLEIVRKVTAPETFQLEIPNDWPDLEFDFRPSNARLVKHDPTLGVTKMFANAAKNARESTDWTLRCLLSLYLTERLELD